MEKKITGSLPQAPVSILVSPDHRILGDQGHHAEKNRSFSRTLHTLKTKRKNFIGTINVNTLIKTGKLKQLTNTLEKFDLKITALQETRFMDEGHFNTENFRIYKGKPAVKSRDKLPLFGTGFAVHNSALDSVIDFSSPNERVSLLSIKSANKAYTLINVHAPTNHHNKSDPEMVENFWEILEETTNKIPRHHVKILLGDFNAQLGKERKFRDTTGLYTKHKRTNKNGEKMINFCRNFGLKIMSTQFQKPLHKLTTWRSPNLKQGEYQIDHIAISKENTKEILNVRTRKGVFESDHYLLQIKTKFQPKRRQKCPPKNIRPDPEYLKLNKEEIINQINQESSTDWKRVKEKIQEAVKLGQPPRTRKHRWWNTICDQAIENRITAWKKFSSNKTEKNWEDFLKTQKQSSKIIRRQKRGYDNGRLHEIQQDFTKNNTRNFYKTFRENLQGYQAPSLCFKKSDGSLETNTKNNCKILAQYFNSLLNCEPPQEKLDFLKPEVTHPDSEAPDLKEITEIIKQLKNNKAPGEDGIIAELWKLDDPILTGKIHDIISDIWMTEQIPDDWKCALIHPLHKKGDKTDINNYRGISLLSVAYKILSKALLNRIEAQADPQIGEYQAGFRKGRSCVEQIWSLKTILQMRKCRNTVITFIDFKKAYDSIDRETLFKIMEEFGIDRKTRKIIEQTLTGTTSKVKFMGEISEPFEIETGVRQGDGLSPILFNIVLEKIIREWETHIKGIQIGVKKGNRIKVKCLAFADDIAIITNNRAEAIHAVEKLHEIARKTGLLISYEKTQYMERRPENKSHLNTKYGKIKQVPHFKYLGETIQSSGLNRIANEQRIIKLQKAYKLTWHHYNKKCISTDAKLRHYKTVILPEALYAAETMVVSGHSKIGEIEKQERKILRKIYGAVNKNGIWMKRPLNELYKKTNTITEEIRKRRAKFYTHIYRMENSRIAKKILNIITTSKCGTEWLKEVDKDLQQINIQNFEDRTECRTRIMNAKFEPRTSRKSGKTWTEERKREHSERMKRLWEERRKKGRPKH